MTLSHVQSLGAKLTIAGFVIVVKPVIRAFQKTSDKVFTGLVGREHISLISKAKESQCCLENQIDTLRTQLMTVSLNEGTLPTNTESLLENLGALKKLSKISTYCMEDLEAHWSKGLDLPQNTFKDCATFIEKVGEWTRNPDQITLPSASSLANHFIEHGLSVDEVVSLVNNLVIGDAPQGYTPFQRAQMRTLEIQAIDRETVTSIASYRANTFSLYNDLGVSPRQAPRTCQIVQPRYELPPRSISGSTYLAYGLQIVFVTWLFGKGFQKKR